MNSKVRFFVTISAFFCHSLFLILGVSAQVPSQLHSPPTIVIKADSQEKAGNLYRLTGHVDLTKADVRLTADRMDYNEATGEVTAKGNVHFSRTGQNEDIWANHANYNVHDESGKFFNVVGSFGGLVKTRPSTVILTTTNPFFFEAERVDRINSEIYRAYNAKITVCSLPDPTWTFFTPEATIHPGESAVLHHSTFRLFHIPAFYFPYFYHSLSRNPRSTGFLTPSFGNSSTLGPFLGDSFYWAINRSADLELGAEYLSKRGSSERGTFRLRPTAGSYLNVAYFGVVDRGIGPQLVNQGGSSVTAQGVAPLPDGFRGVLDFNYLSSLTFREAFSPSYSEAVWSDVHSTAFLTKSIDSMSFNASSSILEDFQSTTPGDTVTIRHLPQFDFNSIERPLWQGSPLRLSWDSSAGLVSRSEPTLLGGVKLATSTLGRLEFYPRISMPLQWEGFRLTPVFGYRVQHYGKQREEGQINNQALNRGIENLSVEFDPPALSKIFSSAGPFYRGKLKHVIEPKVTFLYVNGVNDFTNTLLFDEGDLVTNTSQVEYSLTNRLFAKRTANSPAQEVLSWELKQQYYFDPTFGGALQSGRRNVFLPTLDFDGNAFLDTPRRFSPIVSIFRFRPFSHFDFESREDYDTTLHRFTNGGLLANANWGQTFFSVSQFIVRTPEVLSPSFNQVHFTLGYGKLNRPGFNAVITTSYDIHSGFAQFSAFQMSYNNNCCGISIEFRRFALGPARNENQYKIAFSIANIGSFGNIKREERLF